MVDRSSSMRGDPLQDMKRILGVCLNNLPPDVLFNIIDFGSNHDRLFVESTENTSESRIIAFEHINQLQANSGGTDLLSLLKSLCVLSEKGFCSSHIKL